MTDLNSFYKVDAVDDVMAEDMNRLISSSDYATFRNVETLSADKTLTNTDCPIQYLTPSGANKNVILPAAAVTNHKFVIINPTGTSYSLVVKTSGSVSTLATLTAGQGSVFYSSGGEYITISGGGSSLTKASSTDVATGTDDAKYVTSLAIKNSVNVPNVAPGASNNVLTSNGSAWTSAASIREKLTANRTYYVDPSSGSDTNNGLTTGTSFKTIQYAIDVVAKLDISIYNVTIDLYTATGSAVTYTTTSDILLKDPIGSGNVIITGNSSNQDDVKIYSTAAGNIIRSGFSSKYIIKYLKISSDYPTHSLNGILAELAGIIAIENITFDSLDAGLCTTYRKGSGIITVGAICKFTGAFNIPLLIDGGKLDMYTSGTFNTDGVTSFTTFVRLRFLAFAIFSPSTVFSKTAITGKKYDVSSNSVLYLASITLPGNTAGTTATGGLIV